MRETLNLQIKIPVTATILWLSPFMVGAAPQPSSWYIGAKVGVISASPACEAQAISCDDSDTGAGVFVGYALNKWLAIEGGYDYLGKIEANYPALDHISDTASYSSETQGLTFVAKPYWQLSEDISLFTKIGTLIWDVDVTGHELDFTHHANDRGWSPLLGAGMEYTVNPDWSLLLEYQWINNVGGDNTGGANYSAINLGIMYHFTSTSTLTPAIPPPTTAQTYITQPTSSVQAAWALNNAPFTGNSKTLPAEYKRVLQVSTRRLQAGSVLYYLADQGVAIAQLPTKGAGKAKPIVDNITDEGRYKNRRVELFSPAFNSTTSGEQ